MRSFRHWNPRYIRDRLATMYYERMHPDLPWLTRAANDILATYLQSTDVGLEFGSGRSTKWLANRVARLTSVEHCPEWATKVRALLRASGVDNVDYRERLSDADGLNAQHSAYVKVVDSFEPRSLTFCLVDGVHRDLCALGVLDKLLPGGLLIIDNVNWYLPSSTNSPRSRSPQDGPDGPVWAEVFRRLANWRRIWTTSGVTDTALFFKPCST